MKVYWIYTPHQNLRSYIWTSKVKSKNECSVFIFWNLKYYKIQCNHEKKFKWNNILNKLAIYIIINNPLMEKEMN
jgi:hypothetical protein